MSEKIIFSKSRLPTYVLIGCSRRVGKDTFADYVQAELDWVGLQAIRTAFAEELRKEVALAFAGDPQLDFWTQDPVLKEEVIRPLLIAWGCGRRRQDPDYWARKVQENAELRASFSMFRPIVVVSDWRYVNELNYLRKLGRSVISVCVSRPGAELAGEEPIHAPLCREAADVHVSNDGDLSQLREIATKFVNDVLLPRLNS